MPVPDDATGLVFLRRQDTIVHLDETGQAIHQGYRLRILHANALSLGNLALEWNPAAGGPTVHTVKIYREGQVIDVLKTSSFEIIRREEQLEVAHLNGNLTAVLRVADLRVGDELAVEITTRANDPTLGANEAGLLFLPPDPAPGRIRMEVNWTKGQEPSFAVSPAMASSVTREARSLAFRFENAPTIMPPKDAPVRYQLGRTVEYSDFTDWRAISRLFAPLYAEASAMPDGSPLSSEVARIQAAHRTPLARAQAVLKLVQQDVRYVYVGLDGGNYRPISAQETWRLRYGDCKGKTALLLALLRKMGLAAEPIMASNQGADDGLDQRLPSPRFFDHVLVRARIDGTDWYMDGTLPPVASAQPSPEFPYKWVLPISTDGATIERVEWHPADVPDTIELYEIDARAGFDGPARVTQETIKRGMKGLQDYVRLSPLTAAQLLAGARQAMIGDFWQSIDDVAWRYDDEARASVFTVVGQANVDWDDDGGGAMSLALPGGGITPPGKRVRPGDTDPDIPWTVDAEFVCYVTTVRVPEMTDLRQWSHSREYEQSYFGKAYRRAFDVGDGAVRMVRTSRGLKREITATEAGRDNERIADFDNSKGMVYFDPADDFSREKSGRVLPATYERDWTQDSSACLPD